MKKPSKVWKEFCQIIDIVDIGIGKQQRKLKKLNKEKEQLQELISEYWQIIKQEQDNLKALTVTKEDNALSHFFMRREKIRSLIEDAFFDASITEKELDKVKAEIIVVEQEKLRLEKRKDVLTELLKELI